MKRWMGWIIFVGVFALGVLLIISGIVYEIMIGGEEARNLPARALALSGIILMFGSIYGAAGWRFALWWRTREPEKPEQKR